MNEREDETRYLCEKRSVVTEISVFVKIVVASTEPIMPAL